MEERNLIGQVRDLDSFTLRRLSFFAKSLLAAREEGGTGDLGIGAPGRISLRKKMIPCGRPNCTRCPHGPYWYAYWWERGQLRSRYVGRTLGPDDPDASGLESSGG